MSLDQWLKAKGFEYPEQLTEHQKNSLAVMFEAETKPKPPPPADPAKGSEDEEKRKVKDASFDEKMAAIEAENARIQTIRDLTVKAAAENVGDPDKVRQIRELGEAAIEDKKTDLRDFKLGLLRLDRKVGPLIITPRQQPVTDDVLEAAVCRNAGLENLESHFSPQALEVSHKQFKGGLGLAGVVTICAQRNGYRGHDFKSDWFRAVKHAFQGTDAVDYGPSAAVTGPSTYSLPNILSNVANKFLRVGFMAVDDTWRRISARRNFNDFKTATTMALTGGLLYNKLPPSGEIRHGTIGELPYTNKADTYATMLGIDRQSLVNDDLGALSTAGRRLGRGGALSLNNVFWTVFLNNSTFFTAGNNNVISGGTTALTVTGALDALRQADQAFRLQTDPDGFPLGAMATVLLVPPAVRIAALNAMNSTTVVGSTGPTPEANAFMGAYRVESSPYMQNSSFTGNSATAWYILANPDDVPVIEVGFLNGVEQPTVETEAAEFNMLGIALRGYWDFGCALQEFRGGVRSAGA